MRAGVAVVSSSMHIMAIVVIMVSSVNTVGVAVVCAMDVMGVAVSGAVDKVVLLIVRDAEAGIHLKSSLERDLVFLLAVVSVVRSVMSIAVDAVVGGEIVARDLILHLATEEDLRERKTDGVTELVEVLVVPLSLSISDLVVNILTVDNKVVLNVEDEVPGVGEGLGHLAELVKISTNGSLALLELVSNIMDDVTKVLDSVKNGVEGGVLELVDDTAEALPDVLGIAKALNAVRDLSLDRTGEKTLKNLAHAEESEVHIGALHCLEVVHLLILLVIDLIEELLPVVVEVEEKFLMVDHLGLSVEEHSSSLTEVLASVDPLAHAIVMETLTSVLEHVDTVDDERLVGLKKDLLGVEERLSHPLDLLIIVMINLAAVVEHVADIGHGKTELINSLGGLLVGAVPESTHGVFEMMLNRVGIRNAVSDVGHAMEVKGTDEETLHDARNLGVIMSISSLGGDSDYCSSSESTVHFDLSVCEND